MDSFDEVIERRIGQVVGGRWTLKRLLGAGGMAAVYEAVDAAGSQVALKILHPEMSVRRDIRERFLREAEVMAKIAHPNMVAIYEHGVDADTAFLAMELLDGEGVSDRVRRLGRLPVGEVLVIVDQVLAVLVVAHTQGIIHRDLKPENLYLLRDGRTKVLDFGLARLLDDTPANFRTRTGAALGTLPYMAPEQALGRRSEVDAQTDVFAVGATAFRLLTGRRIHEAPSDAELLMRMASEAAPPLLSVIPDLPPALGLVVDRALSFSKASRYPDARTMQTDVRDLMLGRDPTFASRQLVREAVATRIERAGRPTYALNPVPDTVAIKEGVPASASASAASAPSPRSERAVAATLVMGASRRNVPSSPMAAPPESASLSSTQPDKVAVAQTAEYLAGSLPNPQAPESAKSSRQWLPAPTVSDPSALAAPQPFASAQRSVTEASVARERRKTLVIGVCLIFGLGVATTALGWAYFATRNTETARPSATELPIPLPSSSTKAAPQVLSPLEHPVDTAPQSHAVRHAHPKVRSAHPERKTLPTSDAASNSAAKPAAPLPIQIQSLDPNAFSISVGTRSGASPALSLDAAGKSKAKPQNANPKSPPARHAK